MDQVQVPAIWQKDQKKDAEGMEGRLCHGESFLQGKPAASWIDCLSRVTPTLGTWTTGTPRPRDFSCPQDLTIEVLLGSQQMGELERVLKLPPYRVPHQLCDVEQVGSPLWTSVSLFHR